MKKFYSLLVAIVFIIGAAQAQCTINPSAQTTPGVNPVAANLPCIVQGVAYNQTLQGQIQTSKDTTIGVSLHIVVDSIRLDSITGLPNGITWNKNPYVLLGGGNGCVQFTGTTTAPVGTYNITGWGNAWVRVTSPTTYAYTYTGQLNQFSPFGDYYVTVCNPNNVNTINADLNAALSVYPNPNNGNFEIIFNGGSRVNGEMKIIDITGRVVYSQKMDVVGFYTKTVDLTNLPKGLYTVQLRTAEGFAAKNISIE